MTNRKTTKNQGEGKRDTAPYDPIHELRVEILSLFRAMIGAFEKRCEANTAAINRCLSDIEQLTKGHKTIEKIITDGLEGLINETVEQRKKIETIRKDMAFLFKPAGPMQ